MPSGLGAPCVDHAALVGQQTRLADFSVVFCAPDHLNLSSNQPVSKCPSEVFIGHGTAGAPKAYRSHQRGQGPVARTGEGSGEIEVKRRVCEGRTLEELGQLGNMFKTLHST